MLTALVLMPALAHSRSPYVGDLHIYNEAGTTVTVSVGGQSRTIRDDGYTRITVPAGEVTVRATHEQFGRDYTIDTERVYVRRGRSTSWVVPPEDEARVEVRNDTSMEGRLYADGRYIATLGPFSSRIVTLPPRSTELVLRSGSLVLESTRLKLRPYADVRMVAEMPRYADLVVDNPLPIPVRLTCARGSVRVVEARGRAVYDDVPVGAFALTATRLSGERVDFSEIDVRPYSGGHWRVDPPTTGVLSIDSDSHRGATVYADGRLVATMQPEADARVVLPLGSVRIEVRDERGRRIEEEWVEIEPYDVARLDFGNDGGHRHRDGAACEHDHPVADADDDAHEHGRRRR